MSLLSGDLASQIFAGFKGRLLSGIIRHQTVPESGGLDALGDPIDTATTDTAIEGFTEAYDDAFRNRAGIPETDLMVNIFAKSCPGVTPSKDDVVRIDHGTVAEWYQLRRVKTDPATALWTCQAFAVPDPAS